MDKKVIRIVCFILVGILVLSLIPAIALAAELAGERTVYFYNDANWPHVYSYFWADCDTTMASWPGVAMTYEGDYIWSCPISDGAGYVIFNNGSSQTADLVLPGDQNMYTYSTGAWSTYEDETACDHQWDEGVVVTAASCDEAGQMEYSCTLCGETRSASIDPTGHLFDGRVCTTCGYQMRMVYYDDPNGWSVVNVYYWSDSDTTMSSWPGDPMTLVEGTIWEAGISPDAQYVIFNNGTEQTADLTLPSGFDLYSGGAWSVYDTCSHSYDDGVITTEPGCTTEGVKTFTCTACGESYTEVVDAAGHHFVDGVCSVCNAVEACDQHIWDEGVVTQEPTCWVAGVRTFTCTACGSTQTESIAAGHDLYVSQVIEPTCTKTGKEYTKCTRCAYSYDRTLPKIDHSYDIPGETVEVSCTSDGYTVYSCSGCGATQNGDIIYHTGHSWEGETCTVCGTVCQHSYVDGICSGCDDGGPAYVQGWYEIGNAAQLYWFADQVNGGNGSICGRLVADIDLGGASWVSMGYYCSDTLEPDTVPYTGTFDGQGHIVSDFVTAGTDNEGLFGYCSSATIRDLGVVGAKVTGWRAGAVAGYALTSTVTNCFAKDCVITGTTSNSVALSSGTVYIAPVAGPQGGIVRNCYAVDCVLVDGTDLEVYTSPVGGVDTQNGYYCNVTADGFSSVRNSTEVTMEQLASGEVTYLLNVGVTDGTQGWYQTCGVGMPGHTGETVYQVTDCGGNVGYSNQDGDLGHDYVDGVCSICGAVDAGSVVQPSLTLDYGTVSFESEILYNIYFNASDLDSVVEMGMITFDSQLTDGTIDDAVAVYSNYSTDGTLYMVATDGVAAKRMADQMWFKIYAKLSDGSYVYTDLNYYSAVRYATSILERDSSSDYMKALVVAMLNYGAEAQLYFGHNTDALANASLTDEQKALNVAYDESLVADVVTADATKSANFVYTS
ncbi:MAG: starch-binding protein, partial [Oscillospiraceae bacterium]|nr:starch-binding protein [Oscillospiraceae bacterium]